MVKNQLGVIDWRQGKRVLKNYMHTHVLQSRKSQIDHGEQINYRLLQIMDDIANSLGESAQNDITDNPLGTLKGDSHEYGGELLRCLAKTVPDLAGPSYHI